VSSATKSPGVLKKRPLFDAFGYISLKLRMCSSGSVAWFVEAGFEELDETAAHKGAGFAAARVL
jgi:hypothetical protein